ncbi:N(alpha)-acetyltransferase 50, NatE catalytic subunit [Ictidomys tridecemlineatus]|nr:N(alpha)-acetyltransferase 50, NatE catalytic subunit [Ictidomys tridecemlineatus]
MKGRIELGDVTPHNIKQLKRLNQVIFPVSYNDKFYKDVLEVGELAKLAYFNDIAVGAVCCRVDHSQNQKRLYIMTLGCLAPYRRLGIGTKMLNHVLNICEKDGTFDNIYLIFPVPSTQLAHLRPPALLIGQPEARSLLGFSSTSCQPLAQRNGVPASDWPPQ